MPNGWPGTVIIDLISNSTTVHSCGIVFWGVALNEIHWNKGEGIFGMLVLVVTTVKLILMKLTLFRGSSPFLVKYESHEAAAISYSFIPALQFRLVMVALSSLWSLG